MSEPVTPEAAILEWTPGSDPNGIYHMSFSPRQEARMRAIIRDEVALILARLPSESALPQTTGDAGSSGSASG
jgi:hypothetical protein